MRKRPEQMRGETASRGDGEQGYMLLGLIVAIAIILLWLGVAAADMAHTVRVERERESARRAQQYVRAIRLFYKKNNSYPGSVKALENTNFIRYLRQQYTDPLTGKPYRLIGVGQNKTTVKGFFGQPLGGLGGSGLPGPVSPTSPTTTTSPTGPTSPTSPTNPTTTTSGFANTGFGTASGSGSTGPFMGVGSDAKGDSILIVNEQTTYETWEFLYDPRIEALYKAAALNAGVNSGGLGQSGNGNSGAGQTGFGQTGFGQTGFGQTGGTNTSGATNSTGSAGSPGGTPPTGP